MVAEQELASVYIPQGESPGQGDATTHHEVPTHIAVAVCAPQAVEIGYGQLEALVSGSQESPFAGGVGGHGSGQPSPSQGQQPSES
jgi:hypothetical protein